MRSRSCLGGILLVVALLFPVDASACSCIWSGPLLTVAPRTELVVRATVLSYHASAMDVGVIEVLKGVSNSSRIRVWEDNGEQCRPYVSRFPIGTVWILAVVSNPEPESAPAADYAISACGEYWARVENGNAIGRLSTPQYPGDKPEVMSLTDLRERLQKSSR